jgi:hypothetical protein
MNRVPYNDVEDHEYPLAHKMFEVTGKGPSHYENISDYAFKNDDLSNFLKQWNFTELYSIYYSTPKKRSQHKHFGKTVIDENKQTLMIILKISPYMFKKIGNDEGDDWEDENERTLSVYSNISDSGYELFREDLFKILKKHKTKENNISLIVQTRHGYDTQTFDLPKQKLDLEHNYGSSFTPIHDKILSTLNQKKGKGLVLLHGEPGTGKTFYLKYLASKIKDKKVMFVPPYLVDFITSPEMTPFLIENSDSILFIEDAERVITDRDTNAANGVSNILNLTDGILGDILNIQIVATFNMDRKKIDTALLRKGRLIAEHKFDKLKVDDANKLIKHLGMDHVATDDMTLTEIYNLQEIEYKAEETKRKIGF